MNLLQFVCAFYVLGSVVAALSAATSADGVIFPDQLQSRTRSHNGGCDPPCAQLNALPVSLAKKLSHVTSAEQFMQQFVENGEDVIASDGQASGVRTRFGIPSAQSNDAGRPPPVANCRPELRTINLRDTNDPTVIYYPTCVRLEQCGGCCSHELLECKATNTSQANVTIRITKFSGKRTLTYIGKKTVTLTRHDYCECDCKITSKDCRGRQIYRKDECRCVCENSDEERECNNYPSKLWNPSTCQCDCRYTKDCSSGYYYDPNYCNCTRAQVWQRNHSPFFYRTKL